MYDGTHDPVLVTQLLALLQGRAEPQAQSATDTPDPSVTSHFTGAGSSTAVTSTAVADGRHGTDVVVSTTTEAEPHNGSPEPLTIKVTRVLHPNQQPSHTDTTESRGYITAGRRLPDGNENRGPFAILRDAAR